MKYLIDMHTFLWFINNDDKLSVTAKNLIEFPQNIIYMSIASVWEMAIKSSLGKLNVPSPFTDFIDDQVEENNIEILGITINHLGMGLRKPRQEMRGKVF